MDNLRDQWIIVARWFTAPGRVAGWESEREQILSGENLRI